VPNGLALCRLHHAAFDRYVIGIRADSSSRSAATFSRSVMGRCLRFGLQEIDGQRLLVPAAALRSTMNDLVHAAAELARPLAARLEKRVALLEVVLADETSREPIVHRPNVVTAARFFKGLGRGTVYPVHRAVQGRMHGAVHGRFSAAGSGPFEGAWQSADSASIGTMPHEIVRPARRGGEPYRLACEAPASSSLAMLAVGQLRQPRTGRPSGRSLAVRHVVSCRRFLFRPSVRKRGRSTRQESGARLS